MNINPTLSGSFHASFHISVCILPLPGLPRLVVIRAYSGIPSPHCGPPLSIHEGDIIELLLADLHSSWWQVRAARRPPRFISTSVGPMEKNTSLLRRGWWWGSWLGVSSV